MTRVRGQQETRQPEELLRDKEFVRKFEEERLKLAAKSEKLEDAIRSSERLSERDFAIRMNAK